MKRCLAARLTTSTGTKGVFKEKNYLAEYQLINERKVGKRKKRKEASDSGQSLKEMNDIIMRLFEWKKDHWL